MTYRDRRLAKAERLRGWAEKRYEGVAAVQARADVYRGDHAFNTQPGYIPERARLNRAQERSWESAKLADRMSSRAAGIEAAAERAIYSDDPDAIERLRERIAELETERDTVKAFNKSARAGAPNLDLLASSPELRADLASCVRIGSVFVGKGGGFPAYKLTNLSANIARQKQRLAALERAAA